MAIFDLVCKSCGHERKDKYFPTIASLEVPTICTECGNEMEKETPLFQFASFKPFTTRNIRKDGKPVTVTSQSHLDRLCRENHVRPHPHNDTVEAKADVREIGQAVKEERARFPARYRKLKEEVRALGVKEVSPLAARAHETKFGTKQV